MANGWDPQQCAEKLTAAGLVPVGPPEAFEAIVDTPLFHEMCSEREDLYAPVQTIGCFNTGTEQWQFSAPDQVIALWEKLHEQDPNWEIRNCYVCCGGPGPPAAT
jgi:hypothetical protein